MSNYMSAVARSEAKQQRLVEAARKKAAREAVQNLKLRDKQDKQKYLEYRIEEVDDKNKELSDYWQTLETVLEQTLSVNDMIEFDSLRVKDPFRSFTAPHILTAPYSVPNKAKYTSVKPPGLLESALGFKGRYHRELKAAEEEYQKAYERYQQSEKERIAKLNALKAEHEKEKQAYEQKVTQRNQEVDELETSYRKGEPSIIIAYNAMVLERSTYPEEFPQNFRLAYVPESKELVIEYELPDLSVIPKVAEYKYVKTKDTIEEKPAKVSDGKELYQDMVAAIAIRTIHEVFEADQGDHLTLAVFNGYVATVDPATGHDIHPHLVSVRVAKEAFLKLNLARINKRVCLRNLGAQVSPQPEELQAIKPVVEFNMVDKRFVESADVLSELESRPNLMDLNPTEFEVLVSNLFQKWGLETKLTRASRDGGVDVVAFDTRPVLGGKVVIQAKRYKNTVGVSAIRDLYGTMMNEGANKGIIVTTSSYGTDAYEFSKDKPIELIDGGGLLYMLDQVGHQARIVMPDDGKSK